MRIQERQNLSESLDKLAAQRLLYRRAKLSRSIGMLLALCVATLAIVVSFVSNKDFNYAVTTMALVSWFIDKIFLKEFEKNTKQEAAVIQEDFDCTVLDLPWPKHKQHNRPTRDRVKLLASLARNNQSIVKNLENWYTPNGLPDDERQAKVYCQRMNCWWDVNLRICWRNALKVSFLAFVVIALLLSSFSGITVAKLFALVASTLQILAWGVAELKGQNSAIKNIHKMHQMLNELEAEPIIRSEQIRSFQDEIFEHRRTTPPIPDWFFWMNRNQQETEAQTP